MDKSQIEYEALIGKRVSDTHWYRIKCLAKKSGIELDTDGLRLIIELRRLNPRYFNLYPQIHQHLTHYGQQIGSHLGSGITGEGLIHLIHTNLGIHPHRTTMYRWFHRSGNAFQANTVYDRKTAMVVLTNALIYKAKNNRIGA